MSAPIPPGLAPIQLFLTDRSRMEDRWGLCPRKSYLRTAWGPTGYGLQRTRRSTPLASGTLLHDALQPLLAHVQATDTLPSADQLTEAIAAAVAAYDAQVSTRGLDYWGETDAALILFVAEQKLLIEALVRAWVTRRLPQILETERCVEVEQERVVVYRCTCGLGDGLGEWQEHVANGCTGIAPMLRADSIWEARRAPGHFRYREFKTVSQAGPAWTAEWETTMQPYLGALGFEQAHGVTITDAVIEGLVKGPRLGGKDGKPEYQNCPLIYGWCKPGQPPAVPEEWATRYEWWDAVEQKSRRLPKGFQRTLVDRFPGTDTLPPGLEGWLGLVEPEVYAQVLVTVGPLPRKDRLVRSAVDAWIASEEQHRLHLWELGDLIEAVGGDWTHPDVQLTLDTHWPRSWRCQRYGRKYGCEYIDICHELPGWEDPLGGGQYLVRTPHHDPERWQMIQRGLAPGETLPEDDE